MAFCDAVELFNYWAEFPPAHLLLRMYIGYEGQKGTANVMETAQAMRILGGGKRAQKLSSAPEREKHIFAELKQELKKRA